MTPDEYKAKVEEIETAKARELRELAREYAFSNNPYKVGDVISDHLKTIQILSIRFTRATSEEPICVYFGHVLKKNGEPKLDRKGQKIQARIWQGNIEQPKN